MSTNRDYSVCVCVRYVLCVCVCVSVCSFSKPHGTLRRVFRPVRIERLLSGWKHEPVGKRV